MIRKSRNLLLSLIFLGVLALVFTLVRLREKPEEIQEKSDVEAPEILSDYSTTDLRAITITRSGKTLFLSSSDGENWIIADVPPHFRIEQSRLDTTIQALSRLQSRDIIAEDTDDSQLKEFGLLPPVATLTFQDRNNVPGIVEVGITTPSGNARYCRLSGSKRVVLIPSYSVEAVFSSIEDFRDMSLPEVDLKKMTSFELRRNGMVFRIESHSIEDGFTSPGSSFVITSPWKNNYPLDDMTFQKTLQEEMPLPSRAERFLDGADPHAKSFGLDVDTADMLITGDSEGNTLHLVIGANDGQGNRYARFGDRDDSVFLLRESDLALIDADPFKFVSKFVFLGSIFNVSQVMIKKSGKAWIMKRIERGDPEDTNDDRFLMNNLEVPKKEFTSIYQKFISIMYEGKVVDKISLKSSEMKITVSNVKQDINPMVIRYWPYDEVYYQVSIGNNPIDFLVGRYQLDDFMKDLSDLSEYTS